jgi:hypothetical protein
MSKWGVGSGEWGVENGEWRMENGEWRMENGEWGVGSGEWGVGSGEWGVGSGEWGNLVFGATLRVAMTQEASAGRVGWFFRPSSILDLLGVVVSL